MTINLVEGQPPAPGFRLIDGLLVQEIIDQLNEAIAALNAGGSGGTFTDLVAEDSAMLGDSITSEVGFYGTTAVAQQASASQAAVSTVAITPLATTAATQTTPWGFDSQEQADAIATQVNLIITRQAAIITLLNEIRLDLVTLGAIKGAA